MTQTVQFIERLTTFYKYPSVCIYQDKIDDSNIFLSKFKSPDLRKRQAMLYIHIPFCSNMCIYCPFFKINIKKLGHEEINYFVDCMIKELQLYARQPFFQDVPIVNVQLGGGSPMVLETKYLRKIISTIYDCYNMSECKVISIEGNPTTLQSKEKIKALKDMGMTRTSFGIQTFNEKLRKKLGIRSTISDVYKAVDTIKKCDIDEFACDLIYNLPDQNENEIRFNIDRVCDLEPSMVDFYDLNVFPNTKLHKLIEKNYFTTKPSNKNEIIHFETGMETFRENNYELIRSYVFKPINDREPNPKGVLHSFDSDLLAIGPSGRTTLYSNGLNYRNHCSIEKYIKSIESSKLPIEAGNIVSDEMLEERDMILFPYFLKVNKNKINYNRFKDKINDLKISGYIKEEDDSIELTDLGKLWSGNVSYYLHSDREKQRMANTMFSCLSEGKNIFNQDNMNY